MPFSMLIGGFIGWLVPTGRKIVSSETKAATSNGVMM
jgi:hypothetical protein